nr:cell wall-binding repeat-containing protein [Caldicoprobacter guelmensis]
MLTLVFLFTAVFSASIGAVYASSDDNRIAGQNRYETACAVAKAKYTTAEAVIIVRGDDAEDGTPNVVDGLTASVLAGAKDAPILLTEANKLPDVVETTIKELKAEKAYIVGGTGAVSEDVEAELEAMGLEVERVAGQNRFETAVAVAKEANTGSKTAIVTQYLALVDALVAGPLAYVNKYPILLVGQNAVGDTTAKAIKDLGIENVIIVGGTGIISEDVEDELEGLVSGTVTRVAGNDRYLTSLAVAAKFDVKEVALVNGDSFVDAVAASVLGLPIVYVKQNSMIADAEKFIADKASGVKVIGGTGVISSTLAQKAKEAVELRIVSVSAVGAKKLQVAFNKAVDPNKAQFEVKRGTVKPSVKSITFADDKKSAVIEFNVALASGDYSVTVTGLKDVALTATTKVEAAKLTTIEFTSDVAVISSDAKQIKVGVVAKNQYGEEISFSPNVSASKGAFKELKSNVLTIEYSDGKYTVGEKVVVTVVDPATGVVASKTLTVAQAAQVASIKIGELKTDDADLAKKPINVTNLNSNLTKYYIPVEIKDQYGNVLKATDLAGVDILSSNRSIINPKGFKDLNGATVIELQAANPTPATSGTAVITIVAAGTGVTASTTITVLADAKIDAVQLSAPETELKINRAAVLPVTVVDTYGNEIALKDIVIVIDATGTQLKMNDQATLTANGATLATKTNYVTGVTTIEITPTAKNVVLTVVVPSTGKFQSLTLTALDEPVPASIKGMKSSFVSMLANDTSMKTSIVGNVEFLDQYGEAINVNYGAPTGDAYGYTVTPKEATADNTTETGNDIFAKTTPGTDVYVVKLMKGSTVLDELEVPITVVDKDKITQFEIEDPGKLYTGAGAPVAYDREIKVYGKVDGKKVEIPQTMVTFLTNTKGLPIVKDTDNVYRYKTSQLPTGGINTDGKDETATITALVEAGGKTYTVTKDVVYSSAAPKAQSLAFMKDNQEVTAVEISADKLNNGDLYSGIEGFKVVAKDQYNVEWKNVTFVVTSNETGATVSIDSTGKVTVNGTLTIGKSFQINAFIDGLYKAVKVFVK